MSLIAGSAAHDPAVRCLPAASCRTPARVGHPPDAREVSRGVAEPTRLLPVDNRPRLVILFCLPHPHARTPPNRLADIAEAARKVFTEKGYRRTLMTDVGKELGLSHALLYKFVESKEALFQLALIGTATPEPPRRAFHPPPDAVTR